MLGALAPETIMMSRSFPRIDDERLLEKRFTGLAIFSVFCLEEYYHLAFHCLRHVGILL